MDEHSDVGFRRRFTSHRQGYSDVDASVRYGALVPRALDTSNILRRHAGRHLQGELRSAKNLKGRQSVDLKLRSQPLNLSQEVFEWKPIGPWQYISYETDRNFERLLTRSRSEVDALTTEPTRTYAKLALERAREVTAVLPRVYKSPADGIALQTSTDKGTVNLIMEEGQAIMVRAGDDFAVQVTCNLNLNTMIELLDLYEIELRNVS
jgi:hypothetical protein